MADENDAAEKTEDPTQKRLDDAHDRGDVAKSQEVNTWFVIAGATLVLSTFSGSMGGGILTPLRNVIANAGQMHADAGADQHLPPVDVERRLDRLPDPGAHRVGVRLIQDAGHEYDELVAADPGEHVVLPYAGGEPDRPLSSSDVASVR